MMRSRSVMTALACVAVWVSSGCADELTSGVEVGERIGSYKSTKCAGVDDGVEIGKSMCYT